jgi:hypothetical protein
VIDSDVPLDVISFICRKLSGPNVPPYAYTNDVGFKVSSFEQRGRFLRIHAEA